ncbi:jg265 [Pararge aegeria aegeria]|uniref:Jg265 protein n=1 Tax=Pararge aegeria aegeria TaxID=348720 RepID=A0A8S4QLF6_9NEOP|nr:jg265 [Pararge aegeria aegeria]
MDLERSRLRRPHKKAQGHKVGDGENYARSTSTIKSEMRRSVKLPLDLLKWFKGPRIDGRWVKRCWNGDPAPVNAAWVGSQQTTSNKSLGALETRSWILELPTKDLYPAVDINRLN